MKLVFATNNPNKMLEVQDILLDSNLTIMSLADFGLELVPDENGATYEANALIKATKTSELLRRSGCFGLTVLADDSGLEVEALKNLPGVDSALFLGASTPHPIRNAEIIKRLQGANNRVARFICVIACVYPDGRSVTTRAELVGEISHEIIGGNNFGYDPIFFLPEIGKTTAELTREEKNTISHRSKALRKMVKELRK